VNVLAIDPSLRFTGLFSMAEGKASTFVFSPKQRDRMAALSEILSYFITISRSAWDLCVIEDYMVGAKGSQAEVQGEVGGIIRACFMARNIPVIEVPIMTWKSVTGISIKRGTSMPDSDYLNMISKKYQRRFKTTHEGDSFLLYECVKTCAARLLKQEGAQNIRARLEELRITEGDFTP
jgi:hypothetical protein